VLNPRPCALLLFLLVLSAFISAPLVPGTPGDKEDNVSVELREASKSLEGISFNHPYFIAEDRVRTILSLLYFREKGMLKKKTRKRIFLDKEVNALAPLIVDSLSKAGTHKEVFISVTSKKGLTQDKISTFCLFVLGKELNLVFSQVHSSKEESPSFKDWKTRPPEAVQDPVSLKGHGFWELVPGIGQYLKEYHKNWLVIEIEHKEFEPVVTAVEREITPSILIEDRLRRIEERVGLSPTGKAKPGEAVVEQPGPTEPPRKGPSSEEPLDKRLRELKMLLNEELISKKDYDKKKAEILQEEPPKDKGVPDMIKELGRLRDEGLITEGDYDQWKIRLLEKL
jgi:hypothetical protein